MTNPLAICDTGIRVRGHRILVELPPAFDHEQKMELDETTATLKMLLIEMNPFADPYKSEADAEKG